MKKVEGNKGIIQFIKFAIVGVSNTAVDGVILFALINTVLNNHHSIAKAVSFTVAVLNSYLWNTVWTFKKEYQQVGDKVPDKTFIFFKFMVVSLIGLGVNVLVFSWAESGIHYQLFGRDLMPFILASGSAILWNFFANKFWTYKK